MIKAKLLTRDGKLVTEFSMPPFQLLPEVCIWGTRCFVLKEPFPTSARNQLPHYYEACPWSVDASKAFEEVQR